MRIKLPVLSLLLPILIYAESVAGVHWTAPTAWKNQGSRPMRAATYTVMATAGDKENAECAVYYFGQGQGGSVDANVTRWLGQFAGPDGKVPPGKTQHRTIHGLKVTSISTSGAYSGMGGPMAASSPVKQDYRLMGAIVEGPQGSIFFKFVGPSRTVAAQAQQFEAMVSSVALDK